MPSPGYDWEAIESEIQIRFIALNPEKQCHFFPAVYQPTRWNTSSKKDKLHPCISCDDEPAVMKLFNDTHCRLPEPLCLCPEHYNQWIRDPKTINRLEDEKQKIRDAVARSLTQGRPRNPSGWYLDLTDEIEEINRILSEKFTVPEINRMNEKEALEILKRVQRIKKTILVQIEDLRSIPGV